MDRQMNKGENASGVLLQVRTIAHKQSQKYCRCSLNAETITLKHYLLEFLHVYGPRRIFPDTLKRRRDSFLGSDARLISVFPANKNRFWKSASG